MSLSQRVQGSSPSALTRFLKGLAEKLGLLSLLEVNPKQKAQEPWFLRPTRISGPTGYQALVLLPGFSMPPAVPALASRLIGMRRPKGCRLIELAPGQHEAYRQALDVATGNRDRGMPR